MNPEREPSLDPTVACDDSEEEPANSMKKMKTDNASNDESLINIEYEESPAVSLVETMLFMDEDEQDNKDDIINKQKVRIRQLENEARDKDSKIQYLVRENIDKDARIKYLEEQIVNSQQEGGYYKPKVRPKEKARIKAALHKQSVVMYQPQQVRQRSRSQPQQLQQHHVQPYSRQRVPPQFHNQNLQQLRRQPNQQAHRPQASNQHHAKKKKQKLEPVYDVGTNLMVLVNTRWNRNKWMDGWVKLNRDGNTHVEFIDAYVRNDKEQDEKQNQRAKKKIFMTVEIPYWDEDRIKPVGSIAAHNPPTIQDPLK